MREREVSIVQCFEIYIYIWKIFAHPGALKGSSFTVLCQAFSSIRLVLSAHAFELRTRNIQVRCSIVDEMGAMGFGGGGGAAVAQYIRMLRAWKSFSYKIYPFEYNAIYHRISSSSRV